MRVRLSALAPTALVLLALAAAEGLVRLGWPPLRSLDALVTAPEQQFSFRDRRSVSIFEGDPLLFWRLQAGLREVAWDFTVVSTNGQGLRHPRPLGPKARGCFRVVCVGDSVTFGYRVPVVFPERPQSWNPDEAPYPRLLEAALRAAAPSRTVEVVALAVPGYSSHQGLAWLRRDLARLQPDLVTWCFGWNDVSLRARADAEAMPVDAPRVAVRRLVLHSQALLYAARWLRARAPAAPAGRPPVERVSTADLAANTLAAARLAREQGAPLVVLSPVYRDAVTYPEEARRMAEHRRGLAAAVRAAGIPYLDLPELQESAWPGNAALFGETIHPSAAGHLLIAARLLTFLRAQGLLAALEGPA